MANRHLVHFADHTIQVTVADKAAAFDEWLNEVLSLYPGERLIVGLDCEWKPNLDASKINRTATLQLCVDTKCLILQLFYMDRIPQILEAFLNDSNVTFVGVEVDDDVMKLRSEYGLGYCNTCNTVDIQQLAMSRWPLLYYRKPGLKALANRVANLPMEKPLHVCRSNWEARVLDEKQIEYACIDAYACYRIGRKLLIGY
ncbi:3'-5' exonuclease-like [Diospyros lotus]|uniref:3'-5' exonuclease-like n=1 Tax=Diospyros lotus TaxID=55363 RepID=UPI0022571DCF|nr:3'-5' exonuclease-like [Diospyros lotus]